MKNETKISLTIYGSDNNNITEVLNLNPTSIHEKNDLISKKGIIRYQQNMWMYEISENNIEDIEELIESLLNVFENKKDELYSLAQEYDIQISIISYLKEGMPSFHFSRELIKFINSINADIDIDLYPLYTE